MTDQKKRPGSAALQALTAAAMTLPAYQAAAATRDETTRVSLRTALYDEAELDPAQVSSDTTERYDIEVGQFRASAPLGEHFAVALDVAYETMSGASPWFVQPDADGRPVQVMSGATIDDARTDILLSLSRYNEAGRRVSLSLGQSTENDYESHNLGLEVEWEDADKMTAYTLGGGVSSDRITPTDAQTRFPSRPDDEDKQSMTVLGGISQILGPKTVIQTALSVSYLDGYLSDPYKLVSVEDDLRQDARPDGRWTAAWTTRLRRRYAGVGATAHLDYRLYGDDWNVVSHTLSLAWYQGVGERLTLTPSLRYYSQSQAFFYQPFFRARRDDNLYSSDYRLSPYGAVTLGLSGEYRWEQLSLTASFERYDSSGDYAVGSVVTENPGLVDFTVLAVGLQYAF
ncbi:DUF3570 domain-containing protein [Abyssibacter profundi]|nr:DUF3570 domain-containing protein [Abyssibacter profundi]